jgi:hypothetical protein
LVLTILGLVLGAIGILATVIIASRQRKPKRVTYDVIANRRIITQTGYQVTKALVVTYGDRNLSDPHLIVVRVANTGKVEVRPEDWEEPLSLTTSSEIVDSGVVGTSSKDLKVEAAPVESHQIRFGKMLLNQGEWFDVQMLVDGPGNVSEASARIAGARLEQGKSAKPAPAPVSSKSRRYRRPWWRRPVILGTVLILYLVIIIGAVFAVPPIFNKPTVRVPKLIGVSTSQVVQDLRRANLHLGNERFIASLEPAGTIIDQYPGAGSEVDPGSEVSIVIATHSS